jgi:dipeptidyl aminopeptidase/acylaminoacyl peptidase
LVTPFRAAALAVGGLLALGLAVLLGRTGDEAPDGPRTADCRTPDRPGPSTACPEAAWNAVLYTIGLSTDPYGSSAPEGIGVATGIGTDRQRTVEIRSGDLGWFGGAEWIDEERIVVGRRAPPFRRHAVYRFDDGRLEPAGSSPVPALDATQTWSPGGELVASEPIVPCKSGQASVWACYRSSGRVMIQRADGSGRRKIWDGHVDSWTPDGRLLVTDRVRQSVYAALDPRSERHTLPLSPERVAARTGVRRAGLGPPRWSADGRYVAARAGIRWPGRDDRVSTLVVARAGGQVVRFVTSPFIISMFAWSPTGHRLAYSTSGFPDPHELFLLDEPDGEPRVLFETGARHFDWIAWSPDSRSILLDDEGASRWLLFPTAGRPRFRALRRPGGRPLWCCPVNAYGTLNG